MRRILLFSFLLLALMVSPAAAGDEVGKNVPQQEIGLCADGCPESELAKRGCCSWHGGVCGCRAGRTVCCDGSLSPSCTCRDGEVEKPES